MKYRIYSDNAAFQGLETLKANRNKRHGRRAFFVEGVRSINAADRYGWRIDAFIYDGSAKLSGWARDMLDRNKAVDIYELKSGLMKELSSKTDASELIAIVHMRDGGGGENHDAGDGGAVNRRRKQARGGGARDAFLVDNAQNELPDSHSPPANPVYVLFDRPSGKGNLGALLRSCDAFGVNKLYCAGHSVDIYDPEVIASSTGSFFTVPFELLSKADEIDKLIDGLRREHPGLLVAGTSAHAAQSAYDADLGGPLLLLIGNESDGLSWRLKHLADALISIPMSPVSYATSLNVSCAATALLYEAFRRRRGANP